MTYFLDSVRRPFERGLALALLCAAVCAACNSANLMVPAPDGGATGGRRGAGGHPGAGGTGGLGTGGGTGGLGTGGGTGGRRTDGGSAPGTPYPCVGMVDAGVNGDGGPLTCVVGQTFCYVTEHMAPRYSEPHCLVLTAACAQNPTDDCLCGYPGITHCASECIWGSGVGITLYCPYP